MLDLDRLFSLPNIPAAVPNCAQENSPESDARNNRDRDKSPAPVPSLPDTEKYPLSQMLQGNPQNQAAPAWGKVGHSGHNGPDPILDQVCPPNPLQHKAIDGLGTLGTVGTVDFQGGEGQATHGAPGGGAALELFAPHPSAVTLLLAWCKKIGADDQERMAALMNLEKLSPGEQVRHWHGACIQKGLKPWLLLTAPVPSAGHDCTICSHLTTRQFAESNGRRRFHWACGLGYLILETGRGTERIWIAPPECTSWERWYPSNMR